MKIFRYFIYDVLNISNENEVIIKEFKYDSTTLVLDFYKELLYEYIIKNEDKFNKKKLSIDDTSFVIVDFGRNIDINNQTCDLFLSELIGNCDNKKYCVIPRFSVGGIFAIYKNYRIVINSNENNHLRFPHVHVYNQIGQSVIVSLINFKITGDLKIEKKIKEKILDYLKENQEKLIELYNQIIEHKEIEKVVIDKII